MSGFRGSPIFNANCEGLENIQGEINRDKCATYCSSTSCIKGDFKAKGILINIGNHFLECCPKCKNKNYLFKESISIQRARKLGFKE